MPRIGLAQDMGQLLGRIAQRLELAVVAFRPAYLHPAYASRAHFRFAPELVCAWPDLIALANGVEAQRRTAMGLDIEKAVGLLHKEPKEILRALVQRWGTPMTVLWLCHEVAYWVGGGPHELARVRAHRIECFAASAEIVSLDVREGDTFMMLPAGNTRALVVLAHQEPASARTRGFWQRLANEQQRALEIRASEHTGGITARRLREEPITALPGLLRSQLAIAADAPIALLRVQAATLPPDLLARVQRELARDRRRRTRARRIHQVGRGNVPRFVYFFD